MIRAAGKLLAALALALPLAAQDTAVQSGEPSQAAHVPFGVGERLEYEVKFKNIRVGSGSMEMLPMDTVRGHDTWHIIFKVSGGVLFYHVNDSYESWIDTHQFMSLRHWQNIDEGSYEPKRRFEIYPERREYVDNNNNTHPSVARPIDVGSFIYFLRTIPLHVGLDTAFDNYFQADRNPVRIKVLRRDTIEVPAGRFAAIVVQPFIKAKGVFGEDGAAQVWLSDDENRIMLQMKSSMKFGSLNLYLKSYHPSPTTRTPTRRLDNQPAKH